MERVNTLINKLQQQINNQQTAQQLLYTAQLLVAELTVENKTNEVGKVSVIMPQSFFVNGIIEENKIIEEPIKIEEKIERIEPEVVVEKLQDEEEITASILPLEIERKQEVAPPIDLTENEKKELHYLILDEGETAPTLTLQDALPAKEVNDLAQNNVQSLNEILKEVRKEVATNLVDTPVKDLRKAIGINDKYLFINELFNGDEAMYERSVKTINNFSVYPEAEQWIKRELHTKLCWIVESDVVHSFDQLVRRRFA